MAVHLSAEAVVSRIPLELNPGKIWIGYSGGLDSRLLLYLLVSVDSPLKIPVAAVHVNHGLSQLADDWEEHCRIVCRDLDVEFHPLRINAGAPAGESQEAWARSLRYAALGDLVGNGEMLLTAHHKDDLAETLLIQLFRGAGPAGQSAMPVITPFRDGWHCRPLLEFSRAELEDRARELGLDWVNDDSNRDERYDRNYLRHSIMPVIKARWRGLTNTLARVARIQAETNSLLHELAEIDLAGCTKGDNGSLSLKAMKKLSPSRVANLLRYWIKSGGHKLPSAAVLERIMTDVLNAGQGADPCVAWNGIEIRRYRDRVFMIPPLPEPPGCDVKLDWNFKGSCPLNFGTLRAEHGKGNGIRMASCPGEGVTIRFRRGSDVIKKNGHHHRVKKLYQESGIPPCFRDHIPLVYIGDTLVAIPGIHVDEGFAAAGDEDAVQIHWTGESTVYALADT